MTPQKFRFQSVLSIEYTLPRVYAKILIMSLVFINYLVKQSVRLRVGSVLELNIESYNCHRYVGSNNSKANWN